MGSENFLTIGFTGDVMLGRLVNEQISTAGYKYPLGNLLKLLRENDINIINLETTLTASTEQVEKIFNFKADPDKVNCLKEAKIDVANLANNHILDFSEQGLVETLSVLDKAKIKYVGAGLTEQDAKKPAIIKKKNIMLGVLGFTDNEPEWKAQQSKAGTNYIEINENGLIEAKKEIMKIRESALLRPKGRSLTSTFFDSGFSGCQKRRISNLKVGVLPFLCIKKIKNKVDILILSIHWGPNMRQRPSRDFINFAHGVIDAGVDILHGHSAHIFQGIEIYKGKVILYDTGDFVDDYYVDPYLRNDRSFFYLIKANKKGIKEIKLIPTLISGMQVNIATGIDYKEAVERLKILSEDFGTEIIDKGDSANILLK